MSPEYVSLFHAFSLINLFFSILLVPMLFVLPPGRNSAFCQNVNAYHIGLAAQCTSAAFELPKRHGC